MRVHVYSDLHLEFAPILFPQDVTSGRLAELVILAGNIHTKRRSVGWAAKTFDQAVVLVGGNHEPYGDSLYAAIAASRLAAARTNRRTTPVYFLEREVCDFKNIDGLNVRIIGATLWTNFLLFGPEQMSTEMARAWQNMNDYTRIKVQNREVAEKIRLTPHDTLRFHVAARTFIEGELSKLYDGLTIVVTHHAPSAKSLSTDQARDPSSSAYASSLETLIEDFQPHLWVHGHIHTSSDYRIGRTRIVCNPRGYHPNYLNPDFDPSLVVEI
ncbi:metallophosphoesterase [Dongia soli]|uniref:Metallophosphoesterase n=1 Tax=Dongia soli TaxID=600628 RepID=A0ABU5EHP0_9PROT|nr:metallophosphoesterase [Dongia soli]MDY0885384.1 metallophosphoesterase [Dongia soli]